MTSEEEEQRLKRQQMTDQIDRMDQQLNDLNTLVEAMLTPEQKAEREKRRDAVNRFNEAFRKARREGMPLPPKPLWMH